MNLGRLDRQGKLFTAGSSIGVGGAVKSTPVFICDLGLSDEKDNPNTKNVPAAKRESEETDSVFLSRWFDGLKTGMLLSVEGHMLEIIRRQELGRREGWRITGREVT